jgi:hypothetical protein
MSRDAREQAQLETLADKQYNLQEYWQELTDYDRGEYDGLSGYNCDPSESEDYKRGFADGYEYAQRMGANING